MTSNLSVRLQSIFSASLFAAFITLSGCSSLKSSDTRVEKSDSESTRIVGRGAQPAYFGGRSTVVFDPGSKNTTRVISQKEFGYVRLENIENGAGPNDHPFTIQAESIKAQLSGLEINQDGKREAIFNEDDLNEIAEPIASALGAANPREDITFAVSGKHGKVMWLTSNTVTTGRLFVKDGAINIIFNEIRGDFETQFFTRGVLRPFVPGARAQASSAVTLTSANANHRTANRRDWILLAQNAVPAPSAPQQKITVASPPAATAPATTSTQSTNTAPHAPIDDARHQEIERRLSTLKRLKDKGLISEQEYVGRQREILKEL
ncbi:MAG TPA: SHOCT domain-containing protein [Burkholderiales bacterium]|nr:SHOCT domain-containing protein [Burkholderiales bacterium]